LGRTVLAIAAVTTASRDSVSPIESVRSGLTDTSGGGRRSGRDRARIDDLASLTPVASIHFRSGVAIDTVAAATSIARLHDGSFIHGDNRTAGEDDASTRAAIS
jgi:hypothetical protein